MTNLDDLPCVIHQPGQYLTRDGEQANVIDIKTGSTFSCKGTIRRFGPSGRRRFVYRIWHPSGRMFPLRESSSDIIGPVTQ